ncbi:MAG: hypothetical protein M1834_001351 [Cirrosporium novae-zelandiae]|nr:MAG: hypothetical protein M1834_001351 [Cirrosporium novae-zelandiae]
MVKEIGPYAVAVEYIVLVLLVDVAGGAAYNYLHKIGGTPLEINQPAVPGSIPPSIIFTIPKEPEVKEDGRMMIAEPHTRPLEDHDSKIPILLLKTKSAPTDAYEALFAASNRFHPTFIPVLQHNYNSANLGRLKDFLVSGVFGVDKITKIIYGGLIFTSQRAVEGFARLVHEVGVTPLEKLEMPLYVVGPATSRALGALQEQYLPLSQVRGAETGNGEKLAYYILDNYNTIQEDGTKLPLMFVVGEQRRDIIPKTLMSESLPAADRIQVDELVVYETGVMESFPNDFGTALANNTSKPVIWIVVFSPTGCEVMLHGLGMIDPETGRTRQKDAAENRKYFIATIGPTTRDYLRRTFGLEPDVCAENPSPEGVREGIEKFLQQNS